MNKKHWNTVELEAGIPDAEIRKMIDDSYELVAKKGGSAYAPASSAKMFPDQKFAAERRPSPKTIRSRKTRKN